MQKERGEKRRKTGLKPDTPSERMSGMMVPQFYAGYPGGGEGHRALGTGLPGPLLMG